MPRELSDAPGTSAVDNAPGMDLSCSSMDLHSRGIPANCLNRLAAPKIDSCGSDRFGECLGQLARIQAVLIQQNESPVLWFKLRQHQRERLGGQNRKMAARF